MKNWFISSKEREEKLQKTRPIGKTKIKPIEIEYVFFSKKRKETFEYLEVLQWMLSFQNPTQLRILEKKYSFKTENFGKNLVIKELP